MIVVEFKMYFKNEKKFVRSGIRTHAHRSGLRPERSALDRSAILTTATISFVQRTYVPFIGILPAYA